MRCSPLELVAKIDNLGVHPDLAMSRAKQFLLSQLGGLNVTAEDAVRIRFGGDGRVVAGKSDFSLPFATVGVQDIHRQLVQSGTGPADQLSPSWIAQQFKMTAWKLAAMEHWILKEAVRQLESLTGSTQSDLRETL